MPRKKTAKKPVKTAAPKKTRSKKKFPWGTVLLALLVLVVAAVVVFLVLQQSGSDEELAATVNGEPIYQSDVTEQFKRIQSQNEQLPADQRLSVDEAMVLEETIKKELIMQEAERVGIEVSEEDIDARVSEFKMMFGVNESQFQELLDSQNITLDDLRAGIEEEITLNSYIEEEVLGDITITDSELETYYYDNIESYTAPDGGMRVRHILVEDEDAAWDVLDKALDGDDFKVLAEANSLDAGSAAKGGDLGFITEDGTTVGGSPLVPEFVDAALELEVGEISDPIETQFGWHIILREPDVIPVKDVSDEIRSQLVQEKGREEFLALLDSLMEDAEITYFN